MQRNDMRERPDRTAAVLPRRACQPRKAVLGRDEVLVEALCGQLPWCFMGLHGVCDDGGEMHVAAKVAGEVA